MTFAPQCTKRWQLYEQMSRVLKMCEEAGFDRPWNCIKCEGVVWNGDKYYPHFDSTPTDYEFALSIVEGRPVFRDSEMYRADNGWCCRWSDTGKDWQDEVGNWFDQSEFLLTWNPPQRTIEINGVKVKAPDEIYDGFPSSEPNKHYVATYFNTKADAEAFKAAMEGKK